MAKRWSIILAFADISKHAVPATAVRVCSNCAMPFTESLCAERRALRSSVRRSLWQCRLAQSRTVINRPFAEQHTHFQ